MSEKRDFFDKPLVKWFERIIAIISVIWGFYAEFHTRAPFLEYEIQSKAVLFNNTEELSSVQLMVDTIDVLKSNQNISIVTIKVSNNGNQSLRTSDYDDGFFGLTISDASILKDVSLSEACNQHIEERYRELSPLTSKYFVDIPKISMDKGDWYTITVALLHDNSTSPVIEPKGKIIGQKRIRLVNASSEKPSFWNQLLYGRWYVHLVRWLLYLVISVIAIFIIGGVGISISESVGKRKREGKKQEIAANPDISSFIRDDYLKNEDTYIRIANHYYNLGESRINNVYAKSKSFISDINNINDDDYDNYRSIYLDISRLIERGYLIIDVQGQISTVRTVKESIQKVIDLLGEDEFKYYRRRFNADFYNRIEWDGGESDVKGNQ